MTEPCVFRRESLTSSPARWLALSNVLRLLIRAGLFNCKRVKYSKYPLFVRKQTAKGTQFYFLVIAARWLALSNVLRLLIRAGLFNCKRVKYSKYPLFVRKQTAKGTQFYFLVINFIFYSYINEAC